LVIRLGEALSDPLERIEREYRAREAGGALDSTRAAFVDAPPAAVGNLTNPVEVLREKLEEQLLGALTELLRLTDSGADSDVLLDVHLLLNLGEPLVANASVVVIDMLTAIVDHNFRAIFPAHRTGPSRRFRIIPTALLPASADCAKAREDAVTELAKLHDTFEERRKNADLEFPLDRFFLLDAVTGRGIAAMEDLLDQVYGFIRLLLFSGVRRSTEMVSLLEAECTDLFASFGVASCEVDFRRVRDVLAARMARNVARTLAGRGATVLPAVTEILPSRVLDDPERRDRALEEIDELPVRTLEVDGSRSVQSLGALYDELLERLQTWRETATSNPATPEADSADRPERGGNGAAAGWGLLGALLLGAGVFAVAHFVLVVSVAASALTGGAFALVAFGIIFGLLRHASSDRGPHPPTSAAPSPSATEVLDALEGRVRARRSQLRALASSLDAIAGAFDIEAPIPDATAERRLFVEPLVSDDLLQHLYEGQASDDDLRALADRFVTSVAPWKTLLRDRDGLTSARLEDFCNAHFQELGGQPLFVDPEARACVYDVLRSFVDRWKEGLPVSLEGEAHKQFDRDGFYHVYDSIVMASGDLSADVGTCIREANAVLEVSRRPSEIDDVFVITAVADIHPEAVAPLRNRRD
jgi:hypothetical protein